MDVAEAIKSRRSIRSYKKMDLPKEALDKLIEAAVKAPSAGNAQPWAFVVAFKEETKRMLSEGAYGQKSLLQASAVIVVCVDLNRADESYGERGRTLYCIQDTAAAIENILLTAASLGLGTCWIGAFREENIRGVINAPGHMRPVALIPVGYPDEAPRDRGRRPVGEVVCYEAF